MASTHATIHAILFLITFTNHHFTLIASTPTTTIAKPPRRLAAKLIHRDSTLSPYYNPDDTIADRANRALKTSLARLAAVSKTASDNDDDLQANLIPFDSYGVFFVNFSIGQPPVPQLAVMDTGSNFLWVKCLPCTPCSEKFAPIFDPAKSSTYQYFPCRRSVECSYCKFSDECPYRVTYIRGFESLGVYAHEQLRFDTSDDGKFSVPEVIFGCGRIMETPDGKYNGIFGLSADGFPSLITQLGNRFSYCIGKITDPNYPFNQLILREDAVTEGYSTPLTSLNARYYLNLEGISVGGEMLDIDTTTFQRTQGRNNGVMIDSGTTVTWLTEVAYKALSHKVQGLLGKVGLKMLKETADQLCYSGTIGKDLIGFPAVAFHFADGADLVLDVDGMFLDISSRAFCMAVSPTSAIGKNFEELSIIGVMAQQHYNVGYDLDEKKLYFQRIDCELLAD